MCLDHFGVIAPYYERFIKPGRSEWWYRLLELPCDCVLLDVGGGTGRVSGVLASSVQNTLIVDLSL